MLERYFKQKLAESMQFREIGSWWETKHDRYEIDILAIKLSKNQALVAEVKRQKKNFKPDLFAAKVKHLKDKVLAKYSIETELFLLEDM